MRLISFAMVSLLAITVSAFPPYNPDIDAMDQFQDSGTQNIEQSQNDADLNSQQSYDDDIDMLDQFLDDITQNAQQPQDADIDMLDQLLNDITQNAQQPQDAATQSVQQSQGATSQDLGQSPDYIFQDLEQYLDDITQNAQQSQDAGTQSVQQSPDAATQSVQQSQGATSQDLGQSPDYIFQDLEQYLDDITQNAQQSQDAGTQSVQQSPDATTQNAQQPQESDDQILDRFLYATDQIFQHLQNSATQNLDQSQGAATQSEQQSQGISAQDVDKVLDATTYSAQQSDQDKVLAEINRLTEALKIQDNRCSQIKRHIRSEKQRALEARGMIDKIAMKLRRPSVSSDERLELQKTARNLRMMADELTSGYQEQHQRYTDDMTIRNEMYAELQLLKGNQKLIAKHNSKNEVKVELSPNSCYNIGILETQYDDIIKDTDRLLVKHKRTRDAMLLPGGDALKAESKKFENTIQNLQNYNVVARRILWQHMNGKPIGAGISESFDSYMKNVKI